jgi:hypothetical protein
LKSRTGKAVSSAFETVLNHTKYLKPVKRRTVWVRTDKGKEFRNALFKNLLQREGIQFQVCKNPDIKCSVIERTHRTICDRLCKYFTYKYTYQYIDVLQDFVTSYNATVHSTIGMVPANVTDTDVLAIWNRLQRRRSKVRIRKAKYSFGQHVRSSKDKAIFAKSAEQNFRSEIFRIIKVIHRTPRPVYEIEDLNKQSIDGQIYEEDLTPVRIIKLTQFQIYKIIVTRVRRCIKEHVTVGRDITRTSTVGYLRPVLRKFKMDTERRHFYVTLTSDASVDLYPDNTLADFVIHLSHPIDLGTSSAWEVGLCEVSYKPPKRRIISGTVVDTLGHANVLISVT